MVYRISRHTHLRIDDAKPVPQFWSALWWVVPENHSITSCSIVFHHAIIASLRHAQFIVHFVHYKELLRSLLHRHADFLMPRLNILIPAFLRLLINGGRVRKHFLGIYNCNLCNFWENRVCLQCLQINNLRHLMSVKCPSPTDLRSVLRSQARSPLRSLNMSFALWCL